MANWNLNDASTVSPTITSNGQTYSTSSINYAIGAYKSGDEMETDKSKFRLSTNNNVHDASLVPVPGDLTYFYLNFNIGENNTGSERQASISIMYTDDNDRTNEILFLGKQQPKPTYVTEEADVLTFMNYQLEGILLNVWYPGICELLAVIG